MMACSFFLGWRVNRWVHGAGHWLLPIQGGAVSKTRLAICRGVDGTQGTARDTCLLFGDVCHYIREVKTDDTVVFYVYSVEDLLSFIIGDICNLSIQFY